LLESGDRRCPLLELKVLHLDGILEVHNHMGPGVHLHTGEVKLLVGIVPPVLGLAKVVVHNLQLEILVQGLICPMAEDGILMPQHHHRV
jgi:hypothetical protein